MWSQEDSDLLPRPCESAHLVFFCPACGTEMHIEQDIHDQT
jgi:hypothetical protein